VCRPVGGRQAGNCRHERHGWASGEWGSAGQSAIVASEGRGMCRGDREKPKGKVGHPGEEIDWVGRRAQGCEGRTSAGSGRIHKGFGGCRMKNRACGGFRTKEEKRGEASQSLSQSFFSQTFPEVLSFTPHTQNPFPILPDPGDEIKAERGLMGRRVADRGLWERVGRS